MYQAVVFDFFGTLSVNASRDQRRAGAFRVAEALGVSGDAFFEHVGSTFTERATGATGDLAATMRWLAARCGHSPSGEQIDASCATRQEVETAYIRDLRADAVETVRAVKERGLKIGLLSDCTHELPEVWPTLPVAAYFDATVFSIEEGKRKPRPDLYAAVTARLDVAPKYCLYIGDGGSGELTGATRAGLTAYHLLTPEATSAIVYDADTEWAGPSIETLTEVIGLLDGASGGIR